MKQHADFPNLFVVDHPLIQHKLSYMRDRACETGTFRRLLKEISLLMGYEVTRTLPLKKQSLQTPVEIMDAPVLDAPLPVVVPILRAGLGMAEGLIELIPDCHVGHIGLYRDEQTHKPVEYLVRLPHAPHSLYVLTDPMLATGQSSAHACDVILRHSIPARQIILMCLVAAPEGVEVMKARHPDIRILTASLDHRLNEKAYIVPGLGDAGDRLFGTY
jgi:uracil phosphoribosyltransferase